ncbi:MAG: biosynthetic arginine decarboxylase [Kiritimatiellae bacterium]|nr:biosynthetic arginine decarboxylase [Kiritimatiellia bacterium]MDD5522497.1 biosynthetic arginine decarboxylase [Kiritimatiellia bacterium]
MKAEVLTQWTSEDSAELYGIWNWGAGYFDISKKGTVVVNPHKTNHEIEIDLLDVINDLQRKKFSMPVLLRFADILSSQIYQLNTSFSKAIKEADYKGSYRAVYPIKVNQKQLVIQDILEFGRAFHHGLEAGSKAELIAAIGNIKDPDAPIICNGYKDEEFIDLALHGLRMGLQTFIVLEMPSELPLVIERAKRLGVRPRLGVRAKLSSRAGGLWDASGGDRSKFGLDVSQIVDMVDSLRHAEMLDCLKLLHYHLGSQVSDIRKIRTALQEACRFYVDLVREGASMGIINVGGGLAVDYDGSHTNFACSRNYTMQEYAADVVEIVMNMANEASIPHPTIVSESGRATVAHHSVLVFNILHVRRFEPHNVPKKLPRGTNEMLNNLMEVANGLTPRNAQEAYHDAVYYRDEIRSMFRHGNISIRQRAMAEDIFWHIIRKICNFGLKRKYVPDEMTGLDSAIADVYYGNFSLFQSLPDSWAVDQLFPVMPIHRLNEVPTRQAVIADITCDSDGIIDKFTDLHDVRNTLPLHELNNQEYYLAAFLVGAYQETLGDMHNLLGNINVLHVRVNNKGKVEYVREVPGDSVEEVLSYVEYNPKKLLKHVRKIATRAVKAGKITIKQKQRILKAFNIGMSGYTYFEK